MPAMAARFAAHGKPRRLVALDGYRFQIVRDGRQVRLYSRSGYEWTKRLALLGEALAALDAKHNRRMLLPRDSSCSTFIRLP